MEKDFPAVRKRITSLTSYQSLSIITAENIQGKGFSEGYHFGVKLRELLLLGGEINFGVGKKLSENIS